MKKLITLVLAMAMALSLVACGGVPAPFCFQFRLQQPERHPGGRSEGGPVHVRRGQRPGLEPVRL